MSVSGFVDIPLDNFGGQVSDIAPADLPDGVSPDCQDVSFIPGAVKTRPGLVSVFPMLPGNPTVNYLKTFTTPNLTEYLLALDSNGILYQANTSAALNPIAQNIVPGSRAISTTLFGREYIAFGDGRFGIDIPRQYDATNFDRISQVGPGAPPSVIDGGNATIAISSISQPAAIAMSLWQVDAPGDPAAPGANAFFNVAQTSPPLPPGEIFTAAGVSNPAFNSTGNVITAAVSTGIDYNPAPGDFPLTGNGGTAQSQRATVVTPVPHRLVAGGSVQIAGTGPYDGTWTVLSVIDPVTFTFFADTAGNPTVNTGTITSPALVSAGEHQICVMFQTRQGYITKPSPPGRWLAAGNVTAQVGNIPTGPSNIVARILAFTVAGGANFFYLPSTVVYDNTTTSFAVNFSDAELAAGTPVNPPGQNLFNQLELGECSGVIGYSNRLFWWGERNKVSNFLNLTFDGGWNFGGGFSGSDVPLGWSQVNFQQSRGGSRDSINSVWGDSYKMSATSSTFPPTPDPVCCQTQQPCFKDYLGVRILQDQVAYSVRVRLRTSTVVRSGDFQISVASPTQGLLGTYIVTNAQMAATYTEFIGPLLAPQNIPTDAVLSIQLNNAPLSSFIEVDAIEVFPTAAPYNATIARASSIFANFGGPMPEGYDGVSGVIQLNTNAQPIRAAFVLTDRSSLVANDHLHFVKEGSLYRTQDNGGLPSTWPATQISGTVGTPSVNGVDVGEDWAVIAGRLGLFLYYFGSEPTKISQAIQPLWDSINWQFGYTLWVKVDLQNKRILVGAPFGNATSPNKILMFDYRELLNSSQILETPEVHVSTYSGKMISLAFGRKAAPWNISANCAWFETANENFQVNTTAGVFLGNAVGNGKIYLLSETQFTDDGADIPSYYQTYFFPTQQQEPALQLRSHRKLFGYLTGFVEGSGALSLTAFLDNTQNPMPLPSLNLINRNAPASILSIQRQSGVLTVTCSAGHGLIAGVDVCAVITGVSDPTMNGVFGIAKILSPNGFTVNQAGLPDSAPSLTGASVARLLRDFEMTTNLIAERVSFKVASSGAGSWFKLQKWIPAVKNDPWSPVRGVQ